MAGTHLKNNHGVHYAHPFYDSTLCGDADEGGLDIEETKNVENVSDVVDCPRCLHIVSACVEYAAEKSVQRIGSRRLRKSKGLAQVANR
jgi:hypothetical protein